MTEIISKTLAVTVPTILLGYFIDFSQSFKTAREHGLSMDELKFCNAWSRGGVSSAKIPIKVTGLLIEGASFDGVKLTESLAQSPTLSQVGSALMTRTIPKET